MADIQRKPLGINTPHVSEPANVAPPIIDKPLHPNPQPRGAGLVNQEGMKTDMDGWEKAKVQNQAGKLQDLKAKAALGQKPSLKPSSNLTNGPGEGAKQVVTPIANPLKDPILGKADIKKTYVESQPFIVEASEVDAELKKFEQNPRAEKRKHLRDTSHGVKEYE